MESKFAINSIEYWNARFETNDWEESKGIEQSMYFAKIAMEMIPEWFTREVEKYEYSVCDLGCAEGDAIPFLKDKFVSSEIIGIDVAEKAIEKASEKYKFAKFFTADMFDENNKTTYDVVFCSNVIEHFPVFRDTLKRIFAFSHLYTIIMCPLREDFDVPEHEVIINTNNIPCNIDNNYLIYAQSVKGDIKYYGGEQVLLIYSKKKEDQKIVNLSNLADNLRSVALNDSEKSWKAMNDELYLERENTKTLSKRIEEITEQADKLQYELVDKESKLLVETEKRGAIESNLLFEREKYWNTQESIKELQKSMLDNQDNMKATQNNMKTTQDSMRAIQDNIKTTQDNLYASHIALMQNEEDIKAYLEDMKETYIYLMEGQKDVQDIRNIQKDIQEEQTDINENIKANQKRIIDSLDFITEMQRTEQCFANEKQSVQNEILDIVKRMEGKLYECKESADKNAWNEELYRLEQRKIELEQQRAELENEISRLDENYLNQTHLITERLMNTKAYLIALYLRRFDNQMIKGTGADRKDLIKYTANKIFHTRFKCKGIREYDPLLLADRYIQELYALKKSVVAEVKPTEITDFPSVKDTCQIFIFAGVPFYDVGGGQRCSQLTKTFDKMGYEVHYIYAYESSESQIFNLFNPAISHSYLNNIDEDWLISRLKRNVLFIFEAPYIGFLPYLNLGKRCGITTVYEHIDNWETSLGCLLYDKDSFLQFVEKSDCLIATSLELVKQMHNYTNKEVAYLPNAVDITVFEPAYATEKPHDIVKGKSKTLIYFGSLWGEWFDWDLLVKVAEGCPKCAFNIIGDFVPIIDKVDNFPKNLHFLGLKKQNELPAYLKEADIAILPFKNCEIGKYVSPLKIFEYIAMGKYVLSEPLPDVIGYPNTFCSDVADEWIKAIQGKININSYTEFISQNNWYERCSKILQLTNKYYFDANRYVNKISIIVLNHNNDAVIHRCINSLLIHNNRYHYEIIVVDNNSEDNSLKNLQQNFGDRIKIIENDKNGCSSGRNLGVKNASGEMIVFLDSDQWVISDTWLDAGLYILDNRRSVGAVSWGAGWFTNADCTGPIVDYFENRAITSEKLYRSDLSYLATSGFIMPKILFDKIGGFDESYDPTCFEDTDLSLAVNHEGFQTVYCPYLNIMHLPHQTTNSGSKAHKKLLEKNGEYFVNKWKEKNPKVFERAFKHI